MIKVFFDQDGVLAEYRGLALSEEDFKQEKYFSTLRPQENMIEASRVMHDRPDMEVYVLSAVYIDTPVPVQDKNEWLDKYAPWFDKDHRIFVPVGANKADYIPGGMDKNCFLLDDFSPNLIQWEESGGSGVKIMNGLNGHNGTWQGHSISAARTGREISDAVLFTAHNVLNYRDSEKVDVTKVVKDRHKSVYARNLENKREIRYPDRQVIH